jgi:hypothetical protein
LNFGEKPKAKRPKTHHIIIELKFGQTISDKIDVLLGTPYGTTGELEKCQ